jgi:hypothetical protein
MNQLWMSEWVGDSVNRVALQQLTAFPERVAERAAKPLRIYEHAVPLPLLTEYWG